MDAFHLYSILFSMSFLLFWKPAFSKNSTELKELLNELSWTIKLKLWNESQFTTKNESITTIKPTSQTVLKPPENSRRVGMESLIMPIRRQETQEETRPAESREENNMRMKLFRLMYETIRDSDLKVKRAELIREHYVNSTTFQTGYLLGDLTDKYNTITDISNTLKRFYKEWNSIEHINAYEQIANQAIEINHLIDMVRVMNKRDQQ